MKFDLCGKFDLEVMLAVMFLAKGSWNDICYRVVCDNGRFCIASVSELCLRRSHIKTHCICVYFNYVYRKKYNICSAVVAMTPGVVGTVTEKKNLLGFVTRFVVL